jgi:hypothetical protein
VIVDRLTGQVRPAQIFVAVNIPEAERSSPGAVEGYLQSRRTIGKNPKGHDPNILDQPRGPGLPALGSDPFLLPKSQHPFIVVVRL